MSAYQMGTIESRFAELIWEQEPISSTELVRQAQELLGWKKSTTYTVLKRLCEKGIFRNDRGAVTSVISREKFAALQSEQFVEETFDGSLPAFLAAFTTQKPLTREEVDFLQQMIDSYEEN